MTIEKREAPVLIREVDTDKREVTGIAVPWGQVANIGGWYREEIQKGAVRESDDALLFWRHDEPIGKLISGRDTDAGWEVTMKISATPRGEEAYQLLRDGVIDRFSIGFEPREQIEREEDDGSVTVIRTDIRVREVSLVPFPAYEGATVSDVRHDTSKENKPMPENTPAPASAADVAEVRDGLAELSRQFATGITTREATPGLGEEFGIHFRSFGEYAKALASASHEDHDLAVRAYEGAVSGDAVLKAGWIGDLTHLMSEKQIVLNEFTKGALPAEGVTVEYAQLKSDTTKVEKQDAEGDDLAFGKVAIETKTADIGTYGGYSSLSRQTIERANVGILDTTFTALALKYAKAIELLTRSTVKTAVAALGAGQTISANYGTQDGIVGLLLDLAEKMDANDRTLSGIFVASDVFKALAAVPATDRVLQVSNADRDKVGSMTLTALKADLAGVSVRVFPGATTGTMFAYDSLAVKTLESPGAPTRLQDENIVNLTKDFSVYGYAASFAQIPSGLIKVTKATS